jgi:hypothetical protein
MCSTLSPPQDKKIRGQVTWIKNQLRQADKKNAELFSVLAPDLLIEIHMKFIKVPLRFHINELDSAVDGIGKHEIKSFGVLYISPDYS